MKIANSNIALSAYSKKTEIYAKSTAVEYWEEGGPTVRITDDELKHTGEESAFALDLSDDIERELAKAQGVGKSVLEDPKKLVEDSEQKLLLALQRMIEALTGKKLKLHFVDDAMLDEITSGGERLNWGMTITRTEAYVESESMKFSAEGTVTTEDGRTIDLSFELGMSRTFAVANNFTLSAGNALVDPLVINFDETAMGLSDSKFSFDIDADGTSDQISRLMSGSGFLALDKNGDGTINDGSELFGTKSGDGFADLAAYDSDGNQWIDENDAIYDKLRIWVTDGSGETRLFALGQKGIGAIYLGNAKGEYSHKNAANETNGVVRSTGIFLRENGTAGSIQHVDFAI